jgi:hypothetical protein
VLGGKAAPRVVEHIGGQSQPFGDREGLALPRKADGEPIRRAQRRDVELDRCVRHVRIFGRERLQLGVVRRRRNRGTRGQQALEDGHRERGPLGWIGAGSDLIEEHEAARIGGADEAHDVHEVAREGRQRLGDALLVADVGHHPAVDRQPRPVRGRDAKPGLVHEDEEAKRLERHGLAAGVRTGDDHGPVAESLPEPQVDRHRARPEERVPRREQLERVGHDGRAHRVELCGQPRASHPQVRPCERSERRQQVLAPPLDGVGQVVEDALDLALLVEHRLGPRVVELHDGQRLHEQRCAGRALIVDDALDPPLRLGADRDDVAAGADGHDRLADDAGQVGRPQHRVQPLPHALLRGPHPPADRGELRGGAVEDLPARIDAAFDTVAQRWRLVEQIPHVGEVPPAPAGEPRGEKAGGAERLRDVEELLGGQAAPATSPLQRPAHVARAADRCLGLVVEELRCLVGLLLQERDVPGVAGRRGRLRELARRREGRVRDEQLDDRPELERAQRARIRGLAGGRLPGGLSGGRRAGHRPP